MPVPTTHRPLHRRRRRRRRCRHPPVNARRPAQPLDTAPLPANCGWLEGLAWPAGELDAIGMPRGLGVEAPAGCSADRSAPVRLRPTPSVSAARRAMHLQHGAPPRPVASSRQGTVASSVQGGRAAPLRRQRRAAGGSPPFSTCRPALPRPTPRARAPHPAQLLACSPDPGRGRSLQALPPPPPPPELLPVGPCRCADRVPCATLTYPHPQTARASSTTWCSAAASWPLPTTAASCRPVRGDTTIRLPPASLVGRAPAGLHCLIAPAPCTSCTSFQASISHSNLPAVEDVGLPVNGIMGTSAGALIGSMYAAGYSPREVGAAHFVIQLLLPLCLLCCS